MSYILEALKKAQAERQLGSAPTIHAAPAVPVAASGAAASRKPLLAGVAAGALIAAAAIFAWRQQASAPEASAPSAVKDGVGLAAAPTPAATSSTSNSTQATAQAPTPAAIAILPARTAPAEALPRTSAPAGVPARTAQTANAIAAPHVPARAAVPVQPPLAHVAAPLSARAPARTGATEPLPEQVREAVPAPVQAAPVPSAAADNVPPLSALPEAIQREVPRVAFGGYLYSSNPADRLLLVDKALRHEGEEVAPGLVLEKLLPKAAVMNYKGYRYRVAY